MRENGVFFTPVKYTLVCRVPRVSWAARHTTVYLDSMLACRRISESGTLMNLSLLSSTSPLPGLLEDDGDLTFQKIKFSTHSIEQLVVKSLSTIPEMHFRKLPNSYSLRVQKKNCQLKS